MVEAGRLRHVFILLRNLFLAGLLYAGIYGLINFYETGSFAPQFRPSFPPSYIARPPASTSGSKHGGSNPKISLNPHANWYNRPESLVIAKDDYLGPRPHVDTVANLTLLVETCRGSLAGLEKMRNVFECMMYMANSEKEYYYLPEPKLRASSQDPRLAEFLNADGHENTLSQYKSAKDAMPASKTSIGTCSGPIVPYHMYWTGPSTWRVEIFIKSYLYTQNLPCSRLWVWLDADRNKDAVDNFLHKDPLFKRFLPLVERGDIVLKEWRFPSRIPLPKGLDNTDGLGYYKSPGKPNLKGEVTVADGVVRDANGQEWLALTQKQMAFLPVAVSDAMRFVVLHLYGGIYCDTDILMLRDMRPLVLPEQHSFAERWAAHSHEGDYNTAVMSLTANSSLSSYLVRGGVRMGLNFHPRVIGRMAWKDGRNQEFLMLESAAFDPIWTEFNWDREGRCTVPCLRDYGVAFKGMADSIRDEWESYDEPRLKEIDLGHHQRPRSEAPRTLAKVQETSENTVKHRSEMRRTRKRLVIADDASSLSSGHQQSDGISSAHITDSFGTTPEELAALRKAGLVDDYIFELDAYPPNNRTLQNFFRGSWSYHIHNQWAKHPEPSSWFDVIEHAQDGFFRGDRVNPYGEYWNGPAIESYGQWPEYA